MLHNHIKMTKVVSLIFDEAEQTKAFKGSIRVCIIM